MNTDQWVQAAKAAGCKFAVLTATHETGFGLWQSDVNPYCLKAVKWRDGKGDIVRDFVNSCRKYGIQPGIYVGIRWNSLLGIHNFKVAGDGEFAANRQAWYKRFCEKMVEELCTRYGDLYMIWFDGGADDPRGDGPDVEPIVNKYQPNCLFYHNIDRADFRWGGSETGTVGYPCWSTFPAPCSHHKRIESQKDQIALLKQGDPEGKPSSCWKEHEIEVSDSLLAEFLKKGNFPDFYVLRKARTLNDVLGDDNKFGLKSGSAASADNASIFNSETTKQAVYYSGTQWMRRGSKEDVGGMPVFGHEPLDITRKAGEDIKAFVIGEVSPKHQKLLLAGQNSLLHTRLPLAHSLRETGLQNTLQSGDAVYVPLGDKNVMVKCTYQRDRWEDEKGQDVSDIPFHGVLFHFFLFKTPAYININSSISTQQ